MERVVECLPEFSRSEVLHALDTLSRQGAITLGRRGFKCELRGWRPYRRANSLILLSKPLIDLIAVLP